MRSPGGKKAGGGAGRVERPGLTEEEVEEIREAFNLFDTDGSGACACAAQYERAVAAAPGAVCVQPLHSRLAVVATVRTLPPGRAPRQLALRLVHTRVLLAATHARATPASHVRPPCVLRATGTIDPKELKAAMQSLGFEAKNATI
jgi:hypothetical protein